MPLSRHGSHRHTLRSAAPIHHPDDSLSIPCHRLPEQGLGSETSYEIMGTLFGLTGKFLWWIGLGLVFTATYIPTKILIIVTSLGGSVGKAWEELLVWINPKR